MISLHVEHSERVSKPIPVPLMLASTWIVALITKVESHLFALCVSALHNKLKLKKQRKYFIFTRAAGSLKVQKIHVENETPKFESKA